MTAWLTMLNAALDGATPAELMTGNADALRTVRAAVDAVVVPEDRWWRVGHNRR